MLPASFVFAVGRFYQSTQYDSTLDLPEETHEPLILRLNPDQGC